MTFTLPQLPYAKNSLAPYISAETIDYHYGKHHQTYVDNLNRLVASSDASSDLASKTLPEIIKTAGGSGALFNNAAQVWNHSFYWQCLRPPVAAENAGNTSNINNNQPSAKLAAELTRAFGSPAAFKEEFTKAALALFGSGWVWLVKSPAQHDKLEIISTSNAATPMTSGQIALLTCDVWEHAYYIDYRNARAKYLEAFWQIVNWDFVLENLNN